MKNKGRREERREGLIKGPSERRKNKLNVILQACLSKDDHFFILLCVEGQL